MNLLEARELGPVSDVALVSEQKETCGYRNHEPFGDKFLMHMVLLNLKRSSMRCWFLNERRQPLGGALRE